jgi:hypothetical protein
MLRGSTFCKDCDMANGNDFKSLATGRNAGLFFGIIFGLVAVAMLLAGQVTVGAIVAGISIFSFMAAFDVSVFGRRKSDREDLLRLINEQQMEIDRLRRENRKLKRDQ